MGAQLRFAPSFFGLALRASAEADASSFSAHEDLSITRRPARAGLRLTSPAKASGGRSPMHKERIPMHKKSGFLCRERRARGKRGKGMKRSARRAGNPPQHTMACQGSAVKGDIPPGGILGSPRRGVGRGDPHARKRRARRGFGRAGRGAGKLLVLY